MALIDFLAFLSPRPATCCLRDRVRTRGDWDITRLTIVADLYICLKQHLQRDNACDVERYQLLRSAWNSNRLQSFGTATNPSTLSVYKSILPFARRYLYSFHIAAPAQYSQCM